MCTKKPREVNVPPTATQVPQDVEFKTFTNPAEIDEAEGIVECFVAAIGNKDSVGDIIIPGAFDASLRRRKPRVVWAHNWNEPIGKVLSIEEVRPGDPRLSPQMRAAGVGGLYARVQFNLKSERGREAFASVVFFGEEQEWSIGYKTLKNKFDPQQQANILVEVELYEVSPVLHGANSLVSTLSIKGLDPQRHVIETTIDGEEPTSAMVALIPDDESAKELSVEGGDPPEALHVTLKFLGKLDQWTPEERTKVESMVDDWVKGCREAGLKAKCGGVGTLGDEGAGVYHLDVPGLSALREDLSKMIDDGTEPDTSDRYDSFTPHMTFGYKVASMPERPMREIDFKSARVAWGAEVVDYPLNVKEVGVPQEAVTGEILRGYGPRRGNLERLLRYWRPIMRREGGFTQCVGQLSDNPELYRGPGGVKPLCAWLHHETTGLWPNEGCHHPGMKNCRRKLRGVVNGSRMNDREFEANVRRIVGKDVYSDMPTGEPDRFGEVEEDEDLVTDDDVQFALKVMAQFMEEESDFMAHLSEKDSWVDVDDDENEADIDDDEWQRWTKKGCGCGCDGDCGGGDAPQSDGAIEEKVGRWISTTNEQRVRQAVELLTEVLQSPEMRRQAMDQKSAQTFDLQVDPAEMYHVREHLAPVVDYWGSKVAIDTETGTRLSVEVKSLEEMEALQRAASSLDLTGSRSQ